MPRLPFVPREPEIEAVEIVELEAPTGQGLHEGLRAIPIRRPDKEYNAQVLAALVQEPWRESLLRSAARRIRWMALPALFGLIFTLGISRFLLSAPSGITIDAPKAVPSMAPALPDLPKTLTPAPFPNNRDPKEIPDERR